MNIKALITTLAIVGSSSVAMARPATTTVSANAQITASGSWSFGFGGSAPTVQVRDHRTPVRTTVRTPIRVGTYNPRFASYHNDSYDNDYDRGYDSRQWLELGTRSAGTTTYFTMPTNEPVRALHLEAESGRPVISSIFVRYHDGSQQEIPVNAYLSRGGITVPLVVKNSPIHQIIFWSPEQASGSFSASVAK